MILACSGYVDQHNSELMKGTNYLSRLFVDLFHSFRCSFFRLVMTLTLGGFNENASFSTLDVGGRGAAARVGLNRI
jgi:hypothetical protein